MISCKWKYWMPWLQALVVTFLSLSVSPAIAQTISNNRKAVSAPNPDTLEMSIPMIRSHSKTADIRDGDDFQKSYWTISPEINPDVYHVNRFRGSKRVSVITDMDSVSFIVKPDTTYNFAIVTDNADTAYSQISTMVSPPLPVRLSCTGCPSFDTIPISFGKGGKVYVKGSINNSPPLMLMLDMGSNQVVVSEKGNAMAKINYDGSAKNVAFGGNNEVQNSLKNTLQLSNLVWDSVSIVKMDNADGDGIIGYNIFDGRVIEINFDEMKMVVFTEPVEVSKEHERMDIKFRNGLPFIRATLKNDTTSFSDYFEFDTGSNGSLWINNETAAAHDLYTMPKIGETTSRGLGGQTKNQTVVFSNISLGSMDLFNVPVDLELPSDAENLRWGIFGMDVLKRFNIVMDLRNDALYMEPNTLLIEPYHKPFSKKMLFGLVGIGVLFLAGLFIFRKKKTKT